MLKEVVGHIRRVNTDEFQTASDFRAFLVNICADLVVDGAQRNVNNNNLIRR